MNGKCIAQTQRNGHKHGCERTVTVGTLTFTGHAGLNKVTFQGRLPHSKRLGPGSYTLMITATSDGKRSKPQTLKFTIVK